MYKLHDFHGGGINKTVMLLEKVIPYIKASMLVQKQQKQNQSVPL